jgi:hypothetical protein
VPRAGERGRRHRHARAFRAIEWDIACEDTLAADLDADGRPDLVAGGRATHNVKIYWNRK